MTDPNAVESRARHPVHGSQHGIVCANVVHELKQYLARTHSAVCFGAGTGFVVGDKTPRTVAVDAAVVRNEHIKDGAITSDVFQGAPDLAVIVVSPHDNFDDVESDVHAMLDNGTHHVWIVRPRVRMVTVHDAPRQVSVVGATESLTAPEVLPAFELPVSNLFENA